MRRRFFGLLLMFTFILGLFLQPTQLVIEQVNGNIGIENLVAFAQPQRTTDAVEGIQDTDPPSAWDLFQGGFDYFFSTIIYYLFALPMNWLARLSGMLLDIFMALSIDSQTYRDLGFITSGWQTVRDLVNIGFIFGLLVAAFGLTLNIQKINARRLLINLIIVALMINFSLFFMRVVVDATNILTRALYNSITVETQSGAQDIYQDSSLTGGQKPKSITLGVMGRINPQKIMSQDFFAADVDGKLPSGWERVFLLGLAMLIYGIINAVIAYTFFTVSFLFLFRIVGIALAMVLSPFALVTLIFPGGQSLQRIGFNEWLSTFIKLCFLAPAFTFFLYIIIQFTNASDFFITTSADFWILLISIAMPALIILGLILASKKVAASLSGEIGAQITGFAGGIAKTAIGGVAGLGVATAATGVGFLGQQTLGRYVGGKIADNKWANSSWWLKNKVGKGLNKAGDYLKSSSFDVRKTDFVKNQLLGGKALGGVSLGSTGNLFAGQLEGGYGSQEKKREERKLKAQKEQQERNKLQEDSPEMKELQKRKKLLEKEKDELNDANDNLEIFNETFKEIFESLKKDEEKARQELRDASASGDKVAAQNAGLALQSAKNSLKDFKEGKDVIWTNKEGKTDISKGADRTVDINGANKTFKELQDDKLIVERKVSQANINVKQQQSVVDQKNKKRREDQAKNEPLRWGDTVQGGLQGAATGAALGLALAGPAGAIIGAIRGATAKGFRNYSDPKLKEENDNIRDQIRRGFGNNPNNQNPFRGNLNNNGTPPSGPNAGSGSGTGSGGGTP